MKKDAVFDEYYSFSVYFPVPASTGITRKPPDGLKKFLWEYPGGAERLRSGENAPCNVFIPGDRKTPQGASESLTAFIYGKTAPIRGPFWCIWGRGRLHTGRNGSGSGGCMEA